LNQGHDALKRFVDTVFGRVRIYRGLYGPSPLRVAIVTVICNALIWTINSITSYGIDFRRGDLLLLTFSVAFGFVFDYLSFSKTRAVVYYLASGQRSLATTILVSILDIAIVPILAIPVIILSLEVLDFLLANFPRAVSWILGLDIIFKYQTTPGWTDKTTINWDETFYRQHLSGIPTGILFGLINLVSFALSGIVNLIFLLSIMAYRAKARIPALQEFIDSHTSVQEKPLQILGLLAVGLFAIAFWSCYAVSKLIWF
jgi:hypothetical protein